MTLSEGDIEIGARTLAQECRGQSLSAQLGVAYVLRHRLEHGSFGATLMEICLRNAREASGVTVWQFSGWRGWDPNFSYACGLCDGDPMLEHMIDVLNDAFEGASPDPTQGAFFYHDISIATPPSWKDYPFTLQLDKLKFFSLPAKQSEGATLLANSNPSKGVSNA
jgi:N-acetylmuramoyl-L-alanine amidase